MGSLDQWDVLGNKHMSGYMLRNFQRLLARHPGKDLEIVNVLRRHQHGWERQMRETEIIPRDHGLDLWNHWMRMAEIQIDERVAALPVIPTEQLGML